MRPLIAALVLAAGCLSATTAVAQTKYSATLLCAKADPVQTVPVGDRPDHTLGVQQFKCSWTKPFEIGPDKAKDGVSTETFESSGNKSHAHGVNVTTMQSGDLAVVAYQGTAITKDRALVAIKGTWAYTSGTGKLKGIKGKGTYGCTPSGDSVSCDIEGEYQLPK
jgi:hypothetical protein